MPHVSLITLGVADLCRATSFYERLGWQRSSASVEGTVAFLRGGAVVLGLFGREDLAREAGLEPASDAGDASIALAMNVESEAAVDAALKTASDAGGRITKPAERADWGGYSGYVVDPDGHLWEIAHNPGFPLLSDGRVQLPDADDDA
jgi:predicted lactoylglutathione lyase